MKKLLVTLISSAALSCAALQVQATTLQYKDMNALVREADGIVAGTVREVVSKRGEDKELYTYVTLGDVDVIGGHFYDKELTLMLEGGFDGKEGLDVEGSPHFNAAERVVLFVSGNGRQIVPIVGWGQGLFKLSKDAAGNSIVTDDVGNEVYNIDAKGQVIKAVHAAPSAELNGVPGLAVGSNAMARFNPGKADDGSAVPLLNITPRGTPMSSDSFLELLSKRAASRSYSTDIKSVAIGQALRLPPQDALMAGAKPGSTDVPLKPVAPLGGGAKPTTSR